MIFKFIMITGALMTQVGYTADTPLDAMFQDAAEGAKIPVALLRAVCWVESNHRLNPRFHLDGLTPSVGVCQVKLSAARDTGFTGTLKELRQPIINTQVAAKYLAMKLAKYGDWKRAVTAYNRGHFGKRMSVHNSYVMNVTLAMREGR